MAITFSKNSNLNDELWKTIDTALTTVMQDTDNEKNNDDDLVKTLFREGKSKKFGEKKGGMTEFGNFQPVDEGEAGIQDEIQQGFTKLIEHTPFLKTFTVTREMKDDGMLDTAKLAAANYVRSYKRSRAQFASSCLCGEGSTFDYEGRNLDRTTGDGLALFSTAHPGKKSGVATQSNCFTNAFGTDATMLYKLRSYGRNLKNSSGNVMGYNFDTIIIPSDAWDLEELIKRIIGSERVVGSDFNDTNTQKGAWKLVVNHRWQVNSTSSRPYILSSSEAMRDLDAAVFYDRCVLDVKSEENLKTRNLDYSGYCRFSAGFYDWRAFILGGAAAGTALSY
jgi:hypothetical protein